MKKSLFIASALFVALTANAQNPYLPLWEHLPDGEPRVFDDPDNPGKQRAYIIGSHDVHYDKYCGNDIRMWSAPVDDLSQWRGEGVSLHHAGLRARLHGLRLLRVGLSRQGKGLDDGSRRIYR